MTILSSIVSGAIGGFAATSLGTIAAQRYNRPESEFNQGVIKEGSSPYEERAESAEYRVQIQNTGRSVTTNCKARISLHGTHETTINEPFMTEDGVSHKEVEISKKYKIDIVLE